MCESHATLVAVSLPVVVACVRAILIRSCSVKTTYPTTARTMKRRRTMRKMTRLPFMLDVCEVVCGGYVVVDKMRGAG